MVILGIDSDAKGSIAVLNLLDPRAPSLDVYPIPNLYRTLQKGTQRIGVDYPALVALLTDLISFVGAANIKRIWIEEQRGRPGQDSARTFGFGATYGDIRTAIAAALIANGVHYDTVYELLRFVPGDEWKLLMRLSSDKKKSIALADKLFPECKHAWKLTSKYTSAAEAALLAVYGASKERIRLPAVPFKPPVVSATTVVKRLTTSYTGE